ncbi:nuclear pore complex protein Nup214 isoform X2 [Platichthys flesus]|uniref:nuclear pore complex protein Nup214 isoform X2 n=1 Tax=Platichthys flesus TaxID=8260 RepID=UPI002DB75767|nr:nuclear pore complex protein Nup214 isoform X2 [Platichthys flesus]
MSDDTDSPPEREMKDFQFRQMKKARVFAPAGDLHEERSTLLTLSNKYGLCFVGLNRTFKVYLTHDILAADRVEGTSNEIVNGIPVLAEVTVELAVHQLALSCDELTLSVCGVSEGGGLFLTFYDVRTFTNKAKQQKLPFASLQAAVSSGTMVQDLKWNPAQASTLAVCLSDGSMLILDVTDSVKVQAQLPASSGITCLSWSPKGKQVAAGKMNATVSQYTPALEEKKVIPCPHFYSSSPDEPVKALDVLWLKTFVFAVVYAAADGSLETPPELVLISLPKKDEKVETKHLNFSDTVYGSCTERLHHYFLSHVEDWDLVFAASAASIEVSVISRQDDKIWELWILEDASRAELPVTGTNEDTLPLGFAIDYTSQQDIWISEEKTLPPAPIMLILSTEGLLCPFALLNLNPGAKQLVSVPSPLPLEGERLPKLGSVAAQPPKAAASFPSAPAVFQNLGLTSAAAPTPAAPVASSAAARFSFATTAPVTTSSSAFSFSVPSTGAPSAPSAFSLGGSTPFGSGSSGFSFASKPPSDTPSAPSAFSISTPSIKPSAVAAPPPPIASPLTVKMNLNERFSAVETPAQAPQSLSFTSPIPKPVVSNSSSLTAPPPAVAKPPAVLTPVRPVQTSMLPTVVQKPTPAAQSRIQAPQTPVAPVRAVEKQPQQKKESDHIMAAIFEEIAHFQQELDDLKARSARADFKVGTNEEMKELRKESEDLHIFTLEIKETTESLNGDIGTLKTTLLEGFAGAEEASTQSELSKDDNNRQLLYKKPLDPRSEERLKEIRRLYQYVTFAVEDVNDVLNVEWEKHLEKKKKLKHMSVPGREGLFTTLANNLYIIEQQKHRLDQLVKDLSSLMLYNKTTTSTANQNTAAATTAGLESELESLRDALLKARLDTSPPKTKSRSPVKISPVKQSQLRNFLSKGQMPPVRSTAPANLSRSAFLSPKYYEDLDDVSSTSTMSQSLDPNPAHLELEEEEEEDELQPEPLLVIPQALATPRHPTVVRTPSIQPGFGAIQSTPLNKIHQLQAMGFGLSPIASPVPSNKINLSGPDSTALATKTVKHGAPSVERTGPVTNPAQQAAATAALRRQFANQKTAVVGASLTESTLKTVPQVLNIQELKEKGSPVPVSNIISSPGPDPAAQVFATVSSTQAKRNPNQGIQTMSAESTTTPQTGFVFSHASKPDVSAAPASSADQNSSKGFSFASGATGFGFASAAQGAGISQAKDVSKFSFGGNGKMGFGQAGDEAFPFVPKSTSPALRTASPTLPPNPPGEAARPTSTATALKVEPQPPKPVGGETLGSFSGLRVGQGEEAKDASAKPSIGSFAFVDSGVGMGKGVAQFSFGTGVQKSAEDSTGSLFKPPESASKPAFAVPQSGSATTALPTSFSSLLVESSDSSEEPKATPQPSEATPPPEREAASESIVESASAPEVPDSTGEAATIDTTPAPAALTPPPPLATTAPTPEPPPFIAAPAEAAPPPPYGAVHTIEATADTTNTAPVSTSPAATFPALPVPQVVPAAFQVPSSDKPGSIFTQSAPVTTDSHTIGITTVINTVANTATTPTHTVVSTATTSAATVFGQPVAPPASSAPSAPAITGFGSSGFGASPGANFGKTVFGQVSGFGQPASNTVAASGFSFGQTAFGAGSTIATTGGVGGGGGSLFGASTTSTFPFGQGGANTDSNTGSGPFGQSTAPAFGQSSGFGQGSVFGSNTTTSSSTGFSFGQPSGFGCSSAAPSFGQQPSTGSVFGQQQQQPSSGSVFGSGSANPAGPSAGGGFFSGLGGKPTEEAANKNPFGAPPATGGFGQPAQTGANTLFGSSGAKAFGFGQTSFGEQKPSGTFSTGGGSVASQGFGSFASPTKPGGFGSAPVFGSPPGFGSSPAFGGAASFGANPSFNNMVSSAGKVFGEGTTASSMGGFGFASPPPAPSFGALANQNPPSFGNLAQQGSGFGVQPSSFSGFGQQPQAGGFSGNTFGSSNQSNEPNMPDEEISLE